MLAFQTKPHAGIGRYQVSLMLVTGLVQMGDAMEVSEYVDD